MIKTVQIATCTTLIVAALPTTALSQSLQSVFSTREPVLVGGDPRPVHRIVSIRASGSQGLTAQLEVNRLHGPGAVWGTWDGNPSAAFTFLRGVSSDPDLPRRSSFDVGPWLHSSDSLVFGSSIGNRPWSILADAPGFLDSTWLASPSGEQCIVLEGLPVDADTPERGYWSWQNSPISAGPTSPRWHAGISPAAGELSATSGVFGGVGGSIARIFGEGDAINQGGGVDSGLAIRFVESSPIEGRLIAVCRLWGLEADRSQAVVRVATPDSGEPHEMLARTGGPVSSSLPGRWWTAFHRALLSDSISCDGRTHWAIIGEIGAPRERRCVLVVDGDVLLREGNETPAGALRGAALASDMSSAGDTVVVWAAESQSGGLSTHVFLGPTRLFGVGDWFSHDGHFRLITHVYPLLAIGDSPSGAGLPVYAVVQSVDAAGEPFQAVVRMVTNGMAQRQCDPDLNQDGSADQGDLLVMIEILGGGEPPPGFNPDVNCDGSTDQGDLVEFIALVSGGPCP